MQETLTRYTRELNERKQDQRFRRLRSFCPSARGTVEIDGRQLINFASNDYLGLSQHSLLKQRSIEYVQKYGAGSMASRLMSGNLEPFDKIERTLASLKGSETALILPTGYQANSTALPALLGNNALAGCDRLCHNSLLSGATSGKSQWFRYKHNDLSDLRLKLSLRKTDSCQSTWIVTESVFGMDGDLAPIEDLTRLAAEFNSCLFLDEAHATGVLGENGMGFSGGRQCIAMGTFGKGLGSFGAYIACSAQVREYLINFTAGFIYSTALPPAVLGAIDAALELVPAMKAERAQLANNAEYVRQQLVRAGYDIGRSETHIIPIIVGTDAAALSLASWLEAAAIFAPAIRPPTVETNSARIRVSLTLDHSREQLDHLLKSVKDWHERKN